MKNKSDLPIRKKRRSKAKYPSIEISIDNPRICLQDFTQRRLIGTGTTSKVYLVKKKDTGKNYAMKVMEKSK